ncbi:mechanosensitive ion channel protein MscS [Mycolicibacterium anyangense]|uniref:Mechanosensitive ion channel protein MscS n=1 Tax=Mycolicibacterium anyangense TaxID=1431246 RepID=A0A6N4WBU2_9MYCO|nr:mechanosensitive ion channel family protein [Mycolicibacterium anyangense]BBZ79486.1 mechanosensitive ion channel protein MscS [Mycolicibacterium anyangense]
MTPTKTSMYLAVSSPDLHEFWVGNVGRWLQTKGLHIVLVILAALLATRCINWVAAKIARRLDRGHALVRSEAAKHRRAVASVISSVTIALLYVLVAVDIVDTLGLPVGSLIAPAAVLGAALGFGAQRMVQDLLSGFFIITEKQYGFGDLVQLTATGSANDARGTVEDVTLRVTKLRSGDGEVFTIPNGQIVKSLNLSKDWARAVVDIPVPTSADLNTVNDLLHDVAAAAMRDDRMCQLLLDEPALMGVESMQVDTVNLRMVARTLPGKQFDVGRRLRAMVLESLRQEGIVSPKPHVSATTQS